MSDREQVYNFAQDSYDESGMQLPVCNHETCSNCNSFRWPESNLMIVMKKSNPPHERKRQFPCTCLWYNTTKRTRSWDFLPTSTRGTFSNNLWIPMTTSYVYRPASLRHFFLFVLFLQVSENKNIASCSDQWSGVTTGKHPKEHHPTGAQHHILTMVIAAATQIRHLYGDTKEWAAHSLLFSCSFEYTGRAQNGSCTHTMFSIEPVRFSRAGIPDLNVNCLAVSDIAHDCAYIRRGSREPRVMSGATGQSEPAVPCLMKITHARNYQISTYKDWPAGKG